MPLPVQKFREAVFQILYSHDFGGDSDEMVPLMMETLKTSRSEMGRAMDYVKQILEKLPEIDPRIASMSTEYSFERISRVEKTLLRLSVFEIFFNEEVPPKVAIAEAIRLCRKFATSESSQFVNAILDGVYKTHEASCLTNEPAPC